MNNQQVIEEELFIAALTELDKNNKNYERGAIKYIAFVDTADNIFTNYGINRESFYKKVSDKLSNKASDTKISIKKPTPKKKF